MLFWRGGLLSERVQTAREFAAGDPSLSQVIDFVAESKRGVCMPRGRSTSGDETALLEQ